MGLACWYGVGGSLQSPVLTMSHPSSAAVRNSLFLMKPELKPVELYKGKGGGGGINQALCFKSALNLAY